MRCLGGLGLTGFQTSWAMRPPDRVALPAPHPASITRAEAVNVAFGRQPVPQPLRQARMPKSHLGPNLSGTKVRLLRSLQTALSVAQPEDCTDLLHRLVVVN